MNRNAARIGMALIVTLILSGCNSGTLSYIERDPYHPERPGRITLHVYGVSAHRAVTWMRHYGNESYIGTDGDFRLLTGMTLPRDTVQRVLGYCLFLMAVFSEPRWEDRTPVEPAANRIEELRLAMGDTFDVVDDTSKYKNESEFVKQNGRQPNDFFLIYYTCDLEGYPVVLENYKYTVPAAGVKAQLYNVVDGRTKLLMDYRDGFVAKRLAIISPSLGTFETMGTLSGRRAKAVCEKIKLAFRQHDAMLRNPWDSPLPLN